MSDIPEAPEIGARSVSWIGWARATIAAGPTWSQTPWVFLPTPSNARDKKFSWGQVSEYWNAFRSLFYNLIPLAVAVALSVSLILGLMERSVEIEPIAVPKDLSSGGYTAEVAGQRLYDEINRYIAGAGSRADITKFNLQNPLPNIIIPTVGISLDVIANAIRRFFKIKRRQSISGEFVVQGKLLWLRLRLDGKEIFNSSAAAEPQNPDKLLAAAVPNILNEIQPYLVVASTAKVDPSKAIEIANRIFVRYPETNKNVAWAHNLVGVINIERKNYDVARQHLLKAVKLPRFAIAHANLGWLYLQQGHYSKAKAWYQKAINLDPKDEIAHIGLGDIFYSQKNYAGALREYKTAARLYPSNPEPYLKIGSILRDQSKFAEAVAVLCKALKIDPDNEPAKKALASLAIKRTVPEPAEKAPSKVCTAG